jgi:hypothetical protein
MPYVGQDAKAPQRFCSPGCATSSRGRSTAEETFFRFVNKTDSCWLWTGFLNDDGYGIIKVFLGEERRTISAHRLSWMLHFGEIPDGIEVCHNCPGGDNPSCANPAHLFLGTHKENCEDASRKDRFPKERPWLNGEGNPQSILTAETVLAIKQRHRAGGVTHQELADQYGVSRPTISVMLSGRTWSHVSDA